MRRNLLLGFVVILIVQMHAVAQNEMRGVVESISGRGREWTLKLRGVSQTVHCDWRTEIRGRDGREIDFSSLRGRALKLAGSRRDDGSFYATSIEVQQYCTPEYCSPSGCD